MKSHWWCWVGAVVLVGALGVSEARANPPAGKIFEALGEEQKGLLGEDIHVDVEMGVWWARLDGGLSSLVDSWNSLEGYESSITEASQSIGTGRGLVQQVGMSLQLKDNYAALDYLSDRLVGLGQDEAEERVDNPLARELIQQFIGELRPDLSSLADIDAEVWVRGEYGRFRGRIENPTVFRARNGAPWFPQEDEGWQTEYYAFEVGMFPLEDDDEHWRGGFFGRYRNFSRPLALGYGETIDEVHLQDSEVTVVELGMRMEGLFCGSFCWLLEGSIVPFTGYARMDFGDLGWASSVPLTLGGNIELSYPVSLLDGTFISPYGGFRMEYVMPGNPQLGADLTEVFSDVASGEVDSRMGINVGTPDYFFWGPTLGLNISM